MSVLVSVLTNDRFYSPTHQIHLFWQPQTSHSLSLGGLWQFQFHLRQALETRTGTPDDIASSATKTKPSVRDGMTAKSASRNIFSFLHNCRSHEWLTGYVIFAFPPGTMFLSSVVHLVPQQSHSLSNDVISVQSKLLKYKYAEFFFW